MAVPFNLLRCGCESWIITKDKKIKIEVFNIKFLRRINKMRCDDVKDEKIMNEYVRIRFNNIKNVEN